MRNISLLLATLLFPSLAFADVFYAELFHRVLGNVALHVMGEPQILRRLETTNAFSYRVARTPEEGAEIADYLAIRTGKIRFIQALVAQQPNTRSGTIENMLRSLSNRDLNFLGVETGAIPLADGDWAQDFMIAFFCRALHPSLETWARNSIRDLLIRGGYLSSELVEKRGPKNKEISVRKAKVGGRWKPWIQFLVLQLVDPGRAFDFSEFEHSDREALKEVPIFDLFDVSFESRDFFHIEDPDLLEDWIHFCIQSLPIPVLRMLFELIPIPSQTSFSSWTEGVSLLKERLPSNLAERRGALALAVYEFDNYVSRLGGETRSGEHGFEVQFVIRPGDRSSPDDLRYLIDYAEFLLKEADRLNLKDGFDVFQLTPSDPMKGDPTMDRFRTLIFSGPRTSVRLHRIEAYANAIRGMVSASPSFLKKFLGNFGW